ncbi:oligosaccharyltransferase complex subunit epsilon [Myotisia sp. PD_48]|nr:oligosaccharyltransferase complex subunit epsilon [Myotisia sp. PD_48]
MPPKRTAAGTASPAHPPSPAPGTPFTKTTPPISLSSKSSTVDIAIGVWQQYVTQTAQRTLLLDIFMVFLVLVGGLQFLYCVLAGNYPFNAFLSGFSAAVGQFVLTASLRMQTSDQGKDDGSAKSGPKTGISKSGSSTPALLDRADTSSER